MMLVDMEIAHRLHVEIDQRMSRELFEHMIEKADAGRDGVTAGAVEVDGHVDRGFARLAGDGRGAHGRVHSVLAAPCNLDRVPKRVTPCPNRSEEHTSELQSLMRISYAVFCLKKQKDNTHANDTTYIK